MQQLLEQIKNFEKTGIAGVEKTGLLDGLSEIHKIEMAHLIIAATNYMIEKNVLEDVIIAEVENPLYVFVLPAVRRVSHFLLTNEFGNVTNNTGDRLLQIYEVTDLVDYLIEILPNINRFNFLKYMDYESEFIRTISINYIRKIDSETFRRETIT